MFDTGPDLRRMRTERRARLAHEIEAAGLDGLVLLGPSNAWYAGVAQPLADAMRMHYEPTVVIVDPTGEPHVWTHHPEGVPPEVPADHVHPGLHLEFDEGLVGLAGAIGEALPGARRVGIDELTGPMLARLPGFPGAPGLELVDGAPALGAARLSKTADEIACLRRAQRINELAMYDVEAAVLPGTRLTELTGIFYRRIFELGASTNIIDPIWNVTPKSIAEATLTANGDVGFPHSTDDRFLREGDVVLPDTGLTWNGYHSDFGKTWIASLDPRPSDGLRACYDRWQEVIQAIYRAIKPGATCGDLVRAAMAVEPKPALKQFYIGHGCGCDSAEAPIIGSDLGLAFDDTVVLVPGMTFVLEPVVWRDGVGGYRSEEVVAVTESGFDLLSQYPHTPFGR
jgi:Xaa-Pro dipeptidase